MALLRILLIAILLYYGIKILARWIFHSDRQRLRVRRPGRTNRGNERYRDLTDQRIEDADYEEIDSEEKP